MKAKLYIKGMKEPKDLTLTEGKAAESMIADSKVDDETPFIIEGVWSGRKNQMKFVDWEREQTYSGKKEVELSQSEFDEITDEFNNAKNIAIVNGFNPMYWKDFWFEMRNCVRLEYKRDWQDKKYYSLLVRDPVGYTLTQEILEAYEKKLNKVIYAKEREIEHLERTAEENEVKV